VRLDAFTEPVHILAIQHPTPATTRTARNKGVR
jgi:hypothetical protein